MRTARPFLPIAASAVTILLLFTTAPSQSKERPKLKDFGSSLKRIKWDPQTNAAVETKSKRKETTNITDDDVVRVETSLVVSDLLVLDARGRTVQGLTERDFLITEDEKPQQVGMFSLGDNATVSRSIVLIIDYSSSQLPYIQTSVAAAKSLVDKLMPLDRMAIVTDDVELIQDFTDEKKKLKAKLDSLLNRNRSGGFGSRRFGRSHQYSALMATLKEAFSNEDERPIIIFQTDGDELGSLRNSPITPPAVDKKVFEAWMKWLAKNQREFSLDDICRAAEKSQATIYTVIPGVQLLGLSGEDQMKRFRADFAQRFFAFGAAISDERMKKLLSQISPERLNFEVKVQSALATVATATGGWTMFLEDPSQADKIYSGILSDISQRYIVGYYPTNKDHDGKRRRINIEVRDHQDYVVVGRRWYYAPDPDH